MVGVTVSEDWSMSTLMPIFLYIISSLSLKKIRVNLYSGAR